MKMSVQTTETETVLTLMTEVDNALTKEKNMQNFAIAAIKALDLDPIIGGEIKNRNVLEKSAISSFRDDFVPISVLKTFLLQKEPSATAIEIFEILLREEHDGATALGVELFQGNDTPERVRRAMDEVGRALVAAEEAELKASSKKGGDSCIIGFVVEGINDNNLDPKATVRANAGYENGFSLRKLLGFDDSIFSSAALTKSNNLIDINAINPLVDNIHDIDFSSVLGMNQKSELAEEYVDLDLILTSVLPLMALFLSQSL